MNIETYNEWKKSFIHDLNSKLVNIPNQKGIYDITDTNKLLIVHNTFIPVFQSENELDEDLVVNFNHRIRYYKNSIKGYISLSIQDRYHTDFYIDLRGNIKSVKFVYGPLDYKNVGIIYPEDAYSYDFLSAELPFFLSGNFIENVDEFYTVDSFMDNTIVYNELTYRREDKCFLPKALLCENEVTDYEEKYAEILGVPILYRDNKILKEEYIPKRENKIKIYTNPYI